jgi:hypothetical protein
MDVEQKTMNTEESNNVRVGNLPSKPNIGLNTPSSARAIDSRSSGLNMMNTVNIITIIITNPVVPPHNSGAGCDGSWDESELGFDEFVIISQIIPDGSLDTILKYYFY